MPRDTAQYAACMYSGGMFHIIQVAGYVIIGAVFRILVHLALIDTISTLL